MIAESCGKSLEQVEKDLSRPLYLTPDNAVEYGLVDMVLKVRVACAGLPAPRHGMQRRSPSKSRLANTATGQRCAHGEEGLRAAARAGAAGSLSRHDHEQVSFVTRVCQTLVRSRLAAP
eukprot:scaffold7195_cov417-Prasinococcus_capsulatus_cf.AAC.7